MPRLLSKKTKLGNELSEIKFVKRILLEFGLPDKKDTEIDRVITLAKVDMEQDKMNEKEADKKVVKRPIREAQNEVLDKYVVKICPK